MLTPDQISKMDAVTGLKTPPASQIPSTSANSRVDELHSLTSTPTEISTQSNPSDDTGTNAIANTAKTLINAPGAIANEFTKPDATPNFDSTPGHTAFPIESKVLGAAARTGEALFAPFTGLSKALTSTVGQIVKSNPAIANNPVIKGISDIFNQHQDMINQIVAKDPETAKNIGNALSVIMSSLGVVGVAKTAGEMGLPEQIGQAAQGAKDVAGNAVEAVKTPFKPDVSNLTPEDIAGKVTGATGTQQGTATRGLTAITDQFPAIESNQDLIDVLRGKAQDNTKLVDQALSTGKGANETYTPLDIKELTDNKFDTVQTQLDHLKQLYTDTYDSKSLGDITDLEEKYKDDGLTPKEINDLSKQYGTEFSQKSFNAKGTPKTNISAQAAENIRTQGKDLARQLMPDENTRVLDSETSDVLNTKTMVENMAKKVDALQNKLQVLSPAQKIATGIGGILGKATDIISMGSLKGFINSLEGYSPQSGINSSLMEQNLSTNLDLLDQLNNMSPEEAANKIVDLNEQDNNMFSQPPEQKTLLQQANENLDALAKDYKKATGKDIEPQEILSIQKPPKAIKSLVDQAKDNLSALAANYKKLTGRNIEDDIKK